MTPIFADGTVPKEFFTRESALSLTAVVAMVTIVSNGIQRLINWNPVWFAWLVSEVICFVGILDTNPQPKLLDYLLTVVNGFLVFSAAAGVTSLGEGVVVPKKAPGGGGEILTGGGESPRRGFFTSWFRW